MKQTLLILALLLASCTKEQAIEPQYSLSGNYIVTTGALLPIGQNVLFKSRHFYFDHVGIPYTATKDSIFFNSGDTPTAWKYKNHVWGLILNNASDTAVLLKRV